MLKIGAISVKIEVFYLYSTAMASGISSRQLLLGPGNLGTGGSALQTGTEGTVV